MFKHIFKYTMDTHSNSIFDLFKSEHQTDKHWASNRFKKKDVNGKSVENYFLRPDQTHVKLRMPHACSSGAWQMWDCFGEGKSTSSKT